MLSYDIIIGSLGCILVACSPRQDSVAGRDLPSLFPDAQRALGPFSIHLEKSRDTNVLSEAKVLVEQRRESKHVTLQLKMIHYQEQVTLSFLQQSPPLKKAQGDQGFETLSQGKGIPERTSGSPTAESLQEESFDARCAPSPASAVDALAAQRANRAPAFPDASALFHIPLPLSIRDAIDLVVEGAGDTWAIMDGQLVWDPTRNSTGSIEMNWTRSPVPETRYPLKTLEKPSHLTALRIDGDRETEIPVIWRSGYVWVSAPDVRAGSWLELHFDLAGTDRSLVLPQEPVAEGMKALVMIPGCQRENFILEKSHLSWNCPISEGPVWAASYNFHQTVGGMDFSDWPELARLDPSSVKAFWDAGEELNIETYGSSRLPRAVPEEARRVCMRATWTSRLAHKPMPNTSR